MNNALKRNKKERLEKLRKLKKVTFIISLALNGLFTLLVIIGLCLPKASNTANNNRTSKVLRQTNNAINDNYSNNNCVGFDLNEPYSNNEQNLSFDNQTFTYFNTVNDFIFWGNGGENHTVNNVQITLDLHSPFINFDSITINCLNLSSQSVYKRYYQYIDGRFEANSTGSLYSTQEFAVVLNNSSNKYNEVAEYLTALFPPLNYYDITLSNEWGLSTLFGNGFFFQYSQDYLVKISDDIVFAVGGELYTTMYVHITTYPSEVHTEQGSKVDYNDGYGFIDFVEFKNDFTNNLIVAMSCDTSVVNGQLGYVQNSLHFLNYLYQNVRLFDYNLSAKSNTPRQVSNYDLFYMDNSYISAYSGNGEIGNVFNLFTTAFKGLGGLFSIQIFQGITIGMLLFLPLVGIIVFAIIRIIKK